MRRLSASPHPAWTEIRVLAPEGWCELVAEALALTPCSSVALGRPSLGTPEPAPGFEYVRSFVLRELDTSELRATVERSLAGLAEATGAPELAGIRPSFHELPPEDYANSWRKSWKPFRVAGFAVVTPDDARVLRAGDTRLALIPGGAFGTGRHPTTRGCLRAIRERLRPGQRVLDAGCGNGVLAVASALLGARAALGFDLDPAAIPYARALAADNDVEARLEWRVGGFDCLGPDDLAFDGFCANLFADLIQAHAGDLAGRLVVGGWFAISGCRSDYRPATLRALDAAGLEVEQRRTRGRWDTYVGRRRPAAC